MSPEESVGYQVRATHRAFNRILGQRLAAERITLAQWYFFRALWMEDGLSQRELSTKLGLTEQTTVSALRIMERRGFVVRARDPKDARRIFVTVTAKGRGLERELEAIPRELNLIGIAGEPAEKVKDLVAMLKRIRARLDRYRG